MNFYDKKFKKIVAITVLVLVIVMLGTSILPYIMQQRLREGIIDAE